MNPREAFVKIAREELHVRETTRNNGPGIAKYWLDTSYPSGYMNREPYCAAFVCWVIAEAERRGCKVGPKPRDAAVRNIVSWAKRPGNGAMVFLAGPRDRTPRAGDLVYWRFNSQHPNHIGIVESVSGTAIHTIEANTDGSGSREGDGVYRKRRTIAAAAGFIRLAWKAYPV